MLRGPDHGRTITGGRNVSIVGNRVLIDGKDVTPDAKDIRVEVIGNVERLEADACSSIAVTGDAGSISTQSGDVKVRGNVGGSVQTMSGNVDCGGSIAGNVSTMSGDVNSTAQMSNAAHL
jgi:hypothetical protein